MNEFAWNAFDYFARNFNYISFWFSNYLTILNGKPVRKEVHGAPFHAAGETEADGHVQIFERHPIA